MPTHERTRKAQQRQRAHKQRRSVSSSSDDSERSSGSNSESPRTRESASSDEISFSRRASKDSAVYPVAKLQRLRRIFLNQPTKPKPRRSRATAQVKHRVEARSPVSSRSPSPKVKYSEREKRQPSQEGHATDKRAQHPRKQHIETPSSDDGDEDSSENHRRRRNGGRCPDRIVIPIDDHIHTLCEQVKRLSIQRDLQTNQIHTMLDQAIDELRFLKKQEERTLQSQIQLIHDSFALRLEIFEQQYHAKVAEIQAEMRAAVEREREQSEATILMAAKQLQEQTQQALLNELQPPAVPAVTGSTARRSPVHRNGAAQSGTSHQRKAFRLHHQSIRQGLPTDQAEGDGNVSPVSRQKAKLRALEEKLASFSQDTVQRASKAPTQALDASPGRFPSEAGSPLRKHSPWKPTPLSPLRRRRSTWKNGVSREVTTHEDHASGGEQVAKEDATVADSRARTSRTLSRRFLRPEEEKELVKLRNSIGLAKDWMDQHQ
ncbi:TPA: hypothetical protein N0F65_005171 [Lagenidium giganteum]|uniref:Uncharacterized protein n=1 Tax=Lagenidium giganteum TaxID=4803 RepID=A0AAV2YWI9_9STRA|nr:TPA: hypothetical protein N0F65_005171 [Lagenidium giganteum]